MNLLNWLNLKMREKGGEGGSGGRGGWLDTKIADFNRKCKAKNCAQSPFQVIDYRQQGHFEEMRTGYNFYLPTFLRKDTLDSGPWPASFPDTCSLRHSRMLVILLWRPLLGTPEGPSNLFKLPLDKTWSILFCVCVFFFKFWFWTNYRF